MRLISALHRFPLQQWHFRRIQLKEGQHLPCNVCKHCPVLISQIFTVESAFPETRILSLSSIPLVNDWCPVNVWIQFPVSTSQTRIDVSRDPLTTWTPSNYNRHSALEQKHGLFPYQLGGRPYSQEGGRHSNMEGQNKERARVNSQLGWCAHHQVYRSCLQKHFS